MWKAYSVDYIKNNRSSGISIMAGAFIASLFLSFLGSLFYNFWLDNIEGTKLEDGDWQARIAGEIDSEELEKLYQYDNVEKAVINKELSKEGKQVIDLYFHNKRTVYQDVELLAGELGLESGAVNYNYQLLSLYFVRIPGDDKPRLLLPAYLMIVAMVCVSLILVIHNSFAVSMNSRIYQFGIFSSIGATPGQIRVCLVQEAFMLSTVPLLAGILLGTLLGFCTLKVMNAMTAELAGGREAAFCGHPAVYAAIFLLSVFTVLVSAYLPARKLSRMTPLEAIRGRDELQLKKGKRSIWIKKHSPILAVLFGMEGELAGNALRAQRKVLRTTSWSLTMAFLGFMLMQCFFTLSGISTNHTYFEAYQDAWDVMVTVKDTWIKDFELTEELRVLRGADNCIVYQKAAALCGLPEKMLSRKLLELGGVETFIGKQDGDLLIEAPVMILDDESFKDFCQQAGIEPRLDGTIVLNRFWDSAHSNFRYPEYIPYVREDLETITLMDAGKDETDAASTAEIPVLVCTGEVPLLREEYEKSDYPLVQFLPVSLWKEIEGRIGGMQGDIYIRILAKDPTNPEELSRLENEIMQIVSLKYEAESENRIQEKLANDQMIRGYELVLGAFCVLLAVIGIAHVFSNTLGFLHQRKQEFARYMSVGLTHGGMWKMFGIETLMLVGRPILFTLFLTVIATGGMIKASYLDPMEFIRKAPVWPILLFIFAVFGFVVLAYYLGGRRLMKLNLSEALRNDLA